MNKCDPQSGKKNQSVEIAEKKTSMMEFVWQNY